MQQRFVVCTSRITSGLAELEQMVTDLGGRITTTLDSSVVTHLVAGIPNATKCVQASECSIPIVQESWVRSSWMLWKDMGGKSLTINERNKIPLSSVNDHRVPPLRGQTLSVTGPGFSNRAEIEKRIKLLGGKYTGSFDKNATTILLCDVITAKGAKVNAAVEWGIDAVTIEWLNKVEKVSAWRKFDKYYVQAFLDSKNGDRCSDRGGGSSSSGQNNSRCVSRSSSRNCSRSSSRSSSGGNNPITITNSSSSFTSFSSIGGIKGSSSTTGGNGKHPTIPNIVPNSVDPESIIPSNSVDNASYAAEGEKQSKTYFLNLENFVKKRKKQYNTPQYGLVESSKSRCLDGCRISIHGFPTYPTNISTFVQRQLRMVLRGTGGIFIEDIQNTRVTHVIVPDDYSHKVRYSRDCLKTHYVRLSWLIKSIEQDKLVDPTPHTAPVAVPAPVSTFKNITDASGNELSTSSSLSLDERKHIRGGVDGSNKNRNHSQSLSRSFSSSVVLSRPMKGCVVCVTGYVGQERTEVKRIAKSLGAVFTEYLDQNCRYLVCKKAEGAKYLKACTFTRTDIVSLAWMRKCADGDCIVPFNENIVGQMYRFKKIKKKKKKRGIKRGQINKSLATANAGVSMKRQKNNQGVMAMEEEEDGVAALTRKLCGDGSNNNSAATTPSGTADKLMTEELLALVKRKAGQRTPSNSQTSQEVDLPEDYYESMTSNIRMGTPGMSPKADMHVVENHDESQGVRWGSEDEGVMMTSDEDEG